MSFPEKDDGCFGLYDRLERLVRPPTLSIPSASRNGSSLLPSWPCYVCDTFLTTCLLSGVQLLHTTNVFEEGCSLNNLDDLALGSLPFLNINRDVLA